MSDLKQKKNKIEVHSLNTTFAAVILSSNINLGSKSLAYPARKQLAKKLQSWAWEQDQKVQVEEQKTNLHEYNHDGRGQTISSCLSESSLMARYIY